MGAVGQEPGKAGGVGIRAACEGVQLWAEAPSPQYVLHCSIDFSYGIQR